MPSLGHLLTVCFHCVLCMYERTNKRTNERTCAVADLGGQWSCDVCQYTVPALCAVGERCIDQSFISGTQNYTCGTISAHAFSCLIAGYGRQTSHPSITP